MVGSAGRTSKRRPISAASAVIARRSQHPSSEARSKRRHGDIVGDRKWADDARIGSVGGHQNDPVADRVARRDLAELDAAPSNVERAAASRPRAVDQVGNFVIARADQAGDADDLSGRQIKREPLDRSAGQIVHDGVARTARRERSGGVMARKLAADDRLDEIGFGGGARVDRRRDLAVPQNGRAIGDLHHLVDVMRNEDDACAFGDDRAHQLEQAVDVALRKKRRRLVQHQRPAPRRLPRSSR